VNRELTVNLRLTAATGENAKIASQVTDTLNKIHTAASLAAKAAESVGKSVATMGSAAQTASQNSQALKSGLEGISQSASTAAKSVENLTSSLKKANEAQLSGAAAWTSAAKRYAMAGPGTTAYGSPIGPMPSRAGPGGVEMWTSASTYYGPRSFSQLSGAELGAFARRTTAANPYEMYHSPIGPKRFEDLTGPELSAYARRMTPGYDNNHREVQGPVEPNYGGIIGGIQEDMASKLKEQTEETNRLADARNKLAAIDNKLMTGVTQLGSGITSLARSMVLLTAATDEDAAKMLIMLARFEAVVQAVKGITSVVRGATAVWNAYNKAAAIAATIGGAGMMGGRRGGSTAAGLAGGAIAGGAVAAGGEAAGGFLTSTLVGIGQGLTELSPLATGSAIGRTFLGGVAAGYGATALVNNGLMYDVRGNPLTAGARTGAVNQGYGTQQAFEWDSLTGFLGSTWRARNSQIASADGVARMQQQLAEREEMNSRTSNRRIRDQRIGRAQWDIDTQQSMFLASIQDPARNPNWRDQFVQQGRVNTAEINAIESRLRSSALTITKDDKAEAREKKDEERNQLSERLNELTRQRLSLMQQEAETANRIVASQRQSLAQMGSGDTRRLADAIRTAESGGDLTARQIAMLRQNNIVGYDDQIRTNEERLISRDPNARYIYENQREKTQVDELTRNFNVAVNSEMVLKVQAELDSSAPKWMSEAMKFLTQQVERIKTETANLINQQFDNAARKNEQNGKAQGGGGGGVIPASAGPGIK
jgi:hypothetical protein